MDTYNNTNSITETYPFARLCQVEEWLTWSSVKDYILSRSIWCVYFSVGQTHKTKSYRMMLLYIIVHLCSIHFWMECKDYYLNIKQLLHVLNWSNLVGKCWNHWTSPWYRKVCLESIVSPKVLAFLSWSSANQWTYELIICKYQFLFIFPYLQHKTQNIKISLQSNKLRKG